MIQIIYVVQRGGVVKMVVCVEVMGWVNGRRIEKEWTVNIEDFCSHKFYVEVGIKRWLGMRKGEDGGLMAALVARMKSGWGDDLDDGYVADSEE